MRLAASLLLVLAVASRAVPQEYSERIDVRIRSLDVVVKDAKGNAVRDLQANDFIVLEDGVEQAVTNFAFYDSGATVSEAVQQQIAGATSVESVPPPRRFMFFIDEMAIQGSARATLKKHAAGIVQSMRPGDVATVVRPTGATRIVQEYSGNIETVQKALDKAIDDCRIRITSPAFAELQALRRGLETASTSVEAALAKSEYAERDRERVQHRLAQIRALIATMSRQDGRKVFVLITSGISAQPGRAAYTSEEQMKMFGDPAAGADSSAGDALAEGGTGSLKASLRAAIAASQPKSMWQGSNRVDIGDFREQIDDLARVAAAEGVTIYALEPEVPLAFDFSRGADSSNTGSTIAGDHLGASRVVPEEMFNQVLTYGGETLESLTAKTGGRWFRGTSSIDDTFRNLADDLGTYYSLAYRPGAESGNVRRITVKVRNRPELVVRTRTEVIDRPQGRDMADRVVAALLYPQREDALGMSVKTRRPEKSGRKYDIPVEIVIPVQRLTFMQSDDGTYRALVTIHYAAARDGQELLSYGQHEQIVELSARQHASLASGRYRYQSTITVPKGVITIALGVQDSGSSLASLQTVNVEVR